MQARSIFIGARKMMCTCTALAGQRKMCAPKPDARIQRVHLPYLKMRAPWALHASVACARCKRTLGDAHITCMLGIISYVCTECVRTPHWAACIGHVLVPSS